MKSSVFNFTYHRKPDTRVIYNTFSKAVVEFNEPEFAKVSTAIETDMPAEMMTPELQNEIALLSGNGFLVPKSLDEVAVLKYFHYKTKFSNDRLILTIAPTLQCNFDCPYCYETPRTGKMSRAIQDALLDYIRLKIDSGVKDIDITWYGGEPMLCPDIIEYISSHVLAMADAAGVHVGFSMVTNGSLFTPENVAMLVAQKIHSIQVTIDGLEESHDVRRPYRGGQGSYNTIMRNLALFEGTCIKINVRMNIDRNNVRDFPKLKEIIGQMKHRMEIALYPAVVEHLNKEDTERTELYMLRDEYADFISACYTEKLLEGEGMKVASNRRYFCTAELDNTYVVDEMGNFYKCWDEIGKAECICFNVNTPQDVNYEAIAQYVTDDPFDGESKCVSCCFLPLCFGGCRFQKHFYGKESCDFTESGMIDFLETKYFSDGKSVK